jgi:ribosomal protein S18 acetylase RimI-like enzyme
VTARDGGGHLVAMARLQDDGLYASIWDMIVAPEHRRRGLGRDVFDRLMARAAGRSLVALVATPMGAPMYREAGFSEESAGSVALFVRDPPTAPGR